MTIYPNLIAFLGPSRGAGVRSASGWSGLIGDPAGKPSPCTSIEIRVDAEALRRHGFPFEIVADHPGIPGGDAERVHCVQIDALLGRAETAFPLDLDVVEAMGQFETLDLGTLHVSGAVGYQRELDPKRLQPV